MAKILIVDDRALNRQFLTALLGYAGHQLSEAADGAEALVKIRAEHPDLVITDLLMPTMDGFQLVQQMRREPDIAATDVIFYTATYRLQEADQLAQACGVSVVIPKPSDPEIILNSVNALLNKTELPRVGPSALVPVEKTSPDSDLKVKLTDYVLSMKLLSAQMTDLVEEGADLARRESAAFDLSDKLHQALTNLQAVNLKLASLLELGLELTSHRDPDQLLDIFCRAAVKVIGAKYGVLGMLSDDGQALVHFKSAGENKASLAATNPPAPRVGILGELLDQPRPRRERNPSGDPERLGLSPAHPPIHNFLGVPILSSGQVYGWFYLVDKLGKEEFGDGDEQLVSTLAAQLAVVYEAARMYDEVQRHAAKLELEAHRRKQAEEKFYSAIQAAPNGMLMVDGEGKMVLINEKIVELFGYQPDELVGQPVEMLLPERERQAHVGHRRGFMLNPQTRNMGAGRDLYGRRKDGSEFAVEIGLNPLASNEGLCVLASIIDITERKKSELVMRERMRVAEFTAEISGALATETDLRGMLQKCAEATVQHLDAAFARIWTLNAGQNILELQASAGMYTHIDGGHGRVPVGQFKIGLIALERRPHLTNSVVGDPRVNDQEWAKREGMVGFAGYPLLVDGRLIGVIAMFTRRPIPAAIFEAMASGANEIAVGIERKVAEARAREHFNRIRALHEIDLAITSSLELPEVLRVLLDKVSGFFPFRHACGIAMVNHETGLVEPAACRNISAEDWNAEVAASRADFCRVIIDAKAPLVINDLPEDPRTRDITFFRRNDLASFMGAPLIAKEEVLGVLVYFTKEKHRFSDGEIEFLVTLAGQAAIAIHNAQLHDETKKQQTQLAEQERIQRIVKELSLDITRMGADALVEKLTATVREVFNVDVSDVRFLGNQRWHKVLISSRERAEWLPDGGEFGKGANMWVVNNRRSLAIRDQSESQEFAQGRVARMFGIRGFLATPLISKSGDVIGVIRALSQSPRDFTPGQIDLFEQLASGAAIAIENEQLYANLQKSDKAKSEFLGVMSHELRTPLNIIMGYANIVKDDLAREIDAPHRQSLQIIEHQANSLLAIIDTIMNATRIESGNVTVNKQEVYVADLFEQLKTACPVPKQKEIALVWNLPEAVPNIVTDYEKLSRILGNLINNAIKFTETGTVTISVALRNADCGLRIAESKNEDIELQSENPSEKPETPTLQSAIDLSVMPEESAIRIPQSAIEFSVHDTGMGIAEQNLPYIFEMFRQADSSTTRAYEGAGMGLYIAKKYSDLLGATISVESTVGEGSTFTLTLPVRA